MSIENLIAGVDKLAGSIEKVKNKKKAEVKAAQEKKARLDLAQTFSDSLEGQTATGQMISGGIASGLLNPKDAIGKIPNFSKEEALMMLHAKAVEIKDPNERKIFLDKINQLSEKFDMMNEAQAYYKTRGKLIAKEPGPPPEFGPQGGGLGAPALGGAGQRTGGGRGQAAPNTDLKVTQQQPGDGVVKVPYSLKLHDFYSDLQKFNETDPLYSDKEKTPNPGQGRDKQKWSPDDARAYRARLNDFMDKKIAEKTELGAPGFEAYRKVFATRASEIMENSGPHAFLSTGKSAAGITPKELVLTEDLPMGVLFTGKVEKGKDKGKTVATGINKNVPGAQGAGIANQMLKRVFGKKAPTLQPTDISQPASATAKNKQEKKSMPIAADTDFYLGK